MASAAAEIADLKRQLAEMASAAEIADLKRQIAEMKVAEMKACQARHAVEDMKKKARQARLNADAKARAEEFEARVRNGEFNEIEDEVTAHYMEIAMKRPLSHDDIAQMLEDIVRRCK
jgi:beta-N-acetylglucosaminidase